MQTSRKKGIKPFGWLSLHYQEKNVMNLMHCNPSIYIYIWAIMIFHNLLKIKMLIDGIFTLGNAKKDEITEIRKMC